jgi:hypothetical protein
MNLRQLFEQTKNKKIFFVPLIKISKNLMEREHLGNLGIDARIILK